MAKKGLGQLLKSSLGADFVFKYNDATKEKIKRALADMREEIIDLIVERYVEDKLSSGDIKLNPITLGDRKIMEALAKEHTAEDTLELAVESAARTIETVRSMIKGAYNNATGRVLLDQDKVAELASKAILDPAFKESLDRDGRKEIARMVVAEHCKLSGTPIIG